MEISLFEDKIAFRFIQEIVNGRFVDKTKSGLLVQEGRSKQINEPRLGIAIQVGPDCEEVKEGDCILIEAPMWTNAIEFEEGDQGKFWVTRERNVIAILDPEDISI